MAKASDTTTGPTESVLPQIINFTPEEEAALDEAWEQYWADSEANTTQRQQSHATPSDQDTPDQ